MQESEWQPLPFPLTLVAEPTPLSRLDGNYVLERLLEDATGLAGVLASATACPETEELDVQYAARLLAEQLKALTALWGQWREYREERPTPTAEAQTPEAPEPAPPLAVRKKGATA